MITVMVICCHSLFLIGCQASKGVDLILKDPVYLSHAARQTTRDMLVFTLLAQKLWTADRKRFSGLGLAG